MATKVTQLWQNQVVVASNLPLVAGDVIPMLTSAEIGNDSGTIYNSLKVTLKYEDWTPAIGGLWPWRVGATIEAEKIDGSWYTIASQFNSIRSAGQGDERLIILQPNIDTFNFGVDDVVFPVDRVTQKISRQQGLLPEAKFRVCLLITADPNATNAFQSVKISGESEQYNV